MNATGRECIVCGMNLSDSDYKAVGSWSYTCPRCGFKYNHSSIKTEQEQADDYEEKLAEEEEVYEEEIEEDEEDWDEDEDEDW